MGIHSERDRWQPGTWPDQGLEHGVPPTAFMAMSYTPIKDVRDMDFRVASNATHWVAAMANSGSSAVVGYDSTVTGTAI